MNKQERHYYKKKYNKIKKFINRDFLDYDKEFSINGISGYYQVDFLKKGEQMILLNFAILPDCLYYEFKQRIVSNLKQKEEKKCSNLNHQEDEKCEICSEKSLMYCSCTYCFFQICIECSDRRYVKNRCVYVCPKCNISVKPPNLSVFQRMQILNLRRLQMRMMPLSIKD